MTVKNMTSCSDVVSLKIFLASKNVQAVQKQNISLMVKSSIDGGATALSALALLDL